MPRKNPKKFTSIAISKMTRKMLKNLKKYPRETDEDTLVRLIKKEIEDNSVKPDQLKKEELNGEKSPDVLNNLDKKERKYEH